VFTGTTPANHGIIGNEWFVRKQGNSIYCTDDTTVSSVGSGSKAGRMSPAHLLVTTVTDELRMASNNKSKIIGVALKDRGAILPAGHMANGAYWFDGSNGNWISSTYYMKTLPDWVNRYNERKTAAQYLSSPWMTLLPLAQYTESTEDNVPYEEPFPKETSPVFPHDLPNLAGNGFELIRKTPFGNTITREFAEEAIKGEKLGKGSQTDFLTLSFSSTDYVGHQFGPHSIETEDTYLRLDKEIEKFLQFLDQEIGKENVMVFLTADHAAALNPAFLRDRKIPAGTIDSKWLSDSLKQFLSSTYGASGFISGYSNHQFYLNKKNISERGISLDEVENKCITYLMQFDGIADVLNGSLLRSTEFNTGIRGMVERGYNTKRSGDIMLILEPGWFEWRNQKGTSHGSPFNYDTHVPLIWYGWKIMPGSALDPVKITDIAPTVSEFLKIDAPSAATGTPIRIPVR
jgi:predicted AlkP superfamily pyrophosphatase or phosphodiesterase